MAENYYVKGINLVTGNLRIEELPSISGVSPNVYVDGNGNFYRIVS